MNKKPGFQINIGGETILYLFIGIIICLFVFFMPDIYKFVSDLKTGNLFKKDTPVVDNNDKTPKPVGPDDSTDVVIDELKGDTKLECKKTTSTPDGNLDEIYTFYYNSAALTGVKEEKIYDAISDEYLNYVYSEQARFTNIYNSYSKFAGFTHASVMNKKTLDSIFNYDLEKLDLQALKNPDDETLSIDLKVAKGQTIEEVNSIYTNLGYTCN